MTSPLVSSISAPIGVESSAPPPPPQECPSSGRDKSSPGSPAPEDSLKMVDESSLPRPIGQSHQPPADREPADSSGDNSAKSAELRDEIDEAPRTADSDGSCVSSDARVHDKTDGATTDEVNSGAGRDPPDKQRSADSGLLGKRIDEPPVVSFQFSSSSLSR